MLLPTRMPKDSQGSNYQYRPRWWQLALSAAALFVVPVGLAAYWF